MSDNFLKAFALQTNQVPERYSTSAVTRGRKASRDRQIDEGDEWSAEFWVESAGTLHIRYRNKGT